jgi:hypothetical protein
MGVEAHVGAGSLLLLSTTIASSSCLVASSTCDRLFINAPPDSLGCTERAHGESDGVCTSVNTRIMNASNSSSE